MLRILSSTASSGTGFVGRVGTENRILDFPSQCASGSYTSEGSCRDEQDSPFNAIANSYTGACGVWLGVWTAAKNPNWGGWQVMVSPTFKELNASGCYQTTYETCMESWDGEWYESGPLCWLQYTSPIVVALKGGYKFTSAADGVMFDMDGDGVLQRTAWTYAGDDVAFLAQDRDGDGAIDVREGTLRELHLPWLGQRFRGARDRLHDRHAATGTHRGFQPPVLETASVDRPQP